MIEHDISDRTRGPGAGPAVVWRAHGGGVDDGQWPFDRGDQLPAPAQRLRAHAGDRAAGHQRDPRRPHLAAPAGAGDLPPDGPARPAGGQGAGAGAGGCGNRSGRGDDAAGDPPGVRIRTAGHADPRGCAHRARHRRTPVPLLCHRGLRRAGAPAHHRAARKGDSRHADPGRIHAAPALARDCHGGRHARSAWPRCRSASSAPAPCCARGWTSPPRRRTSSCWPS